MKRLLGKLWMRAYGWRLEAVPLPRRCVLIASPHTSNWDLPHMLAAAWVMGVNVRWLGKASLFKSWRGPLMRSLGGLPVDRSAHHGLVGEVVRLFAEKEDLILAVPPKGTRKAAEFWKSGFYHIAEGAGVPVGLGCLDYGRKVSGIKALITLTGDVHADMDRIRAAYQGVLGKFPAMELEPRLREETQLPSERHAPDMQR